VIVTLTKVNSSFPDDILEARKVLWLDTANRQKDGETVNKIANRRARGRNFFVSMIISSELPVFRFKQFAESWREPRKEE
jgi:hypothetical protein